MSMATEFSHMDMDSTEDQLLFTRRRCCSYRLPRFTFSRSSSTAGLTSSTDQGLFSTGISAFKKLREWSEIMAGPRWKTFIRRFNCRGGGTSGKFQYDEFSYALNFDQGPGQTGNPQEEDDHLRRNFSSRYATFPASKQLRDDFQASSSSSSSQLIVI